MGGRLKVHFFLFKGSLSFCEKRYVALLFPRSTQTMSLVSTSLTLVIVLLFVVVIHSSLVKAQECDCTTVSCTSAWVIPPYDYSWFNITCPAGQEAILDYSLYCGARKQEIHLCGFSIDIHLCLLVFSFFEGSTLFRLIQFLHFLFLTEQSFTTYTIDSSDFDAFKSGETFTYYTAFSTGPTSVSCFNSPSGFMLPSNQLIVAVLCANEAPWNSCHLEYGLVYSCQNVTDSAVSLPPPPKVLVLLHLYFAIEKNIFFLYCIRLLPWRSTNNQRRRLASTASLSLLFR